MRYSSGEIKGCQSNHLDSNVFSILHSFIRNQRGYVQREVEETRDIHFFGGGGGGTRD